MDEMIANGGAVLWIIAGLSVVTLALILWKLWRFLTAGVWASGQTIDAAIALWQRGDAPAALAYLEDQRSVRALLAAAAMDALGDPSLTVALAREDTARQARAMLNALRAGLRPLDLIVTIAPLLGLLGTVLGMISAFQALQDAGVRADPATLAGGIWEALLTTAAGMGVAIPASMALTWFDSVADRVQAQMEDDATRIFIRAPERAAP